MMLEVFWIGKRERTGWIMSGVEDEFNFFRVAVI
jgi:hypothetical protein